MTTPPISRDALLEGLRWRYATKKFDAARRIPEADWQALEEAVVLSPSSFGLQPWKFVVVSDPGLRERLLEHSWGQAQVVEASHFVVFAARRGLNMADVDRHLARTAEVRQVPRESLTPLRERIEGFLAQPREALDVNAWCARQTYLALAQFVTSAALLAIDACPMEGIVPAKYDELLGLGALGCGALAACAVGYRAADDKYAALAKVRFPLNEVIERR